MTVLQKIIRPPQTVMTPLRLGNFMPTRLSFAHVLIRKLRADNWQVQKKWLRVDKKGIGDGCLTARRGKNVFSLLAFFDDIAADARCDRVIAKQWDGAFVLLAGEATKNDVERLRQQAPKQESGRYCARDLIISRANRSVRLFEKTVNCLAAGKQPAADDLLNTGYLMRTTAVYGNGKFGGADLSRVRRLNLPPPFFAEMLTVWLIRELTVELAQETAKQRNRNAVKLLPEKRQLLGVGNSTGLGMAPFLIHHQPLLHRWMVARETAIARVLSLPRADKKTMQKIGELLSRAQKHLLQWPTGDKKQTAINQRTKKDLRQLILRLEKTPQKHPFLFLRQWAAKNANAQTQEWLYSILLEPHGELVDDLTAMMDSPDDDFVGAPWRSLLQFRRLLEKNYAWVKNGDAVYYWYRSADKEEPRRGRRQDKQSAEIRIGIAREMFSLKKHLATMDEKTLRKTTTAEFALRYPEWRGLISRAQTTEKFPYGEVQSDILGRECPPLDLLRAKLSFLGAYKYNPQSSLWLRINLFQGAPFADELQNGDDWAFAAFN